MPQSTNSFGKLLNRLRGNVPLAVIATRAGVETTYLSEVETGTVSITAVQAGRLFRQGFGLSAKDSKQLILGAQLYDLGLKHNELRQFVVDLILETGSPSMRSKAIALYRSYANG